MAPFRPSNLNKRAYPGNANVIGPTTKATLGINTTTCNTFISVVCGAASESFTLGCRFSTCTCPFCHCCCYCSCTVCTRTVPAGLWSSSEQYEARTRDAWGDTNCVTGTTLGCCSACCGTYSSTGPDYKGFYVCCEAGVQKWFVAPSCTQVVRSWYSNADAATVATSTMGSCSWFTPDCQALKTAGFSCRSYWDTYSNCYWSSSQFRGSRAWCVDMTNGSTGYGYWGGLSKDNAIPVRAVRTVSG